MGKELFETLPDVLDAKLLASALSISKAGAYQLLNRPDFPTLQVGGRKLVTNVILSAALASAECRQAVENVKRMEKNADDMEDEKDRNGGHADETKTKENSGGYANSKDFAGGSFSQGV